MKLKAVAFEEACHCQGLLLVPGVIAVGLKGVFARAQMDYNLITSGWPRKYRRVVSLLVCVVLIGPGLRRARLASLQAEKAGGITPELEDALADNVPMVFSGILTLLLPVMAYLAVFEPA